MVCQNIFLRVSIHNIPQKQSLGRIRSLITIKCLMSEVNIVFVNTLHVFHMSDNIVILTRSAFTDGPC